LNLLIFKRTELNAEKSNCFSFFFRPIKNRKTIKALTLIEITKRRRIMPESINNNGRRDTRNVKKEEPKPLATTLTKKSLSGSPPSFFK
jgi:hypothetical protein